MAFILEQGSDVVHRCRSLLPVLLLYHSKLRGAPKFRIPGRVSKSCGSVDVRTECLAVGSREPVGAAFYSRFGFHGPFIFGSICAALDFLAHLLVIERHEAIAWGVDPWVAYHPPTGSALAACLVTDVQRPLTSIPSDFVLMVTTAISDQTNVLELGLIIIMPESHVISCWLGCYKIPKPPFFMTHLLSGVVNSMEEPTLPLPRCFHTSSDLLYSAMVASAGTAKILGFIYHVFGYTKCIINSGQSQFLPLEQLSADMVKGYSNRNQGVQVQESGCCTAGYIDRILVQTLYMREGGKGAGYTGGIPGDGIGPFYG
ncbi:hypothetical protein BKA82DRAFT_4016101 [Pisolithus tinctorius]|nr:hypothetical protein BKA82DRAFT_4016101 [Pisolithus tinctorius]